LLQLRTNEFTLRKVDVVEAVKTNPNRALIILTVSMVINVIMFTILVVLLTTYAGSGDGSSSQQKDMAALESRLMQLESNVWEQDIVVGELDAKINTLENSSAIINLKASKFNIYQPVTHLNSQETVNGQRMWTHRSYSIYASDSIRWEWTSNENIVSTDSNGVPDENPNIHSGVLSLGGSFAMQFTVPGTYYYGSENSQTMGGKVTVMEGPSISLSRESIVFKTPSFTTTEIAKPTSTVNVPVGVQLNLPLDGLDSCWVKCYEEGYDQISSSSFYSPSCSATAGNSDTDWVMVGVKDSPDATFLKVAAFGRYNKVFAKASTSTSGTVTPNLDNGVYWYKAYSSNYGGYTSFGFSQDASIELTDKSGSSYYFLSDGSTTSCEKRLSWPLYRDAGYVAGCTKTASESYRKIVMKNTCEVYSPTATS
jgi:plastocyanin